MEKALLTYVVGGAFSFLFCGMWDIPDGDGCLGDSGIGFYGIVFV